MAEVRKFKTKDTIYRHMFCKDERADETFLEVCNGLFNENWTVQSTFIKDVTLNNFAFSAIHNDVAKIAKIVDS